MARKKLGEKLAKYLAKANSRAKKKTADRLRIEDAIIGNHLIAGRWIIPAAYMLAHAARQLEGQVQIGKRQGLQLSQVVFKKPPEVRGDYPIQTRIDDDTRFRFCSDDETLAEGRYAVTDSPADRLDLAPFQLLPLRGFYARIKPLGYGYGPLLRVADRVIDDGQRAVYRLKNQGSPDQPGLIDPFLLDGVFQCLLHAAGVENLMQAESVMFLPYKIQSLRLYRPMPATCHAVIERSTLRVNGQEIRGSVRVYSKSGKPVLDLEDMVLIKLTTALTNPSDQRFADSSIHAYIPDWRPAAPVADDGRPLLPIVVGGNRPELATALAARHGRVIRLYPAEVFEQIGNDEFRLSFANPEAWPQFLAQLPATALPLFVYGEAFAAGLDSAAADAAMAGLLALCRSLITQSVKARLRIPTLQALAVVPGDSLAGYAAGGIAGFLRTLRLESVIDGTQIDLDDANGLVGAVLAECGPQTEAAVAYRDGVRRVLAYRPAPLGDALPLKPGVYIVAGGAGGIGRKLCLYLAARHDGLHFAWLGRGPYDRDKEEAAMAVRALGGQVDYFQADLTDAKQTAAAIAAIRKLGTVRGVIHSGGSNEESLIRGKDWPSFARVYHAKVRGIELLDRLTADLPLDFFVAFASTIGLTGSVGQCDYSAANALLDSFVHWRNRQKDRHGQAIAIDWTLWHDGGMGLDDGVRQKFLKKTGVIRAALAFPLLERILAGPHAEIAVAGNDRYFRADRESLSDIAIENGVTKGSASPIPARLEQIIELQGAADLSPALNTVELSGATKPSFRQGMPTAAAAEPKSRDRDVTGLRCAPSMAMDPGIPCRGDDTPRLNSTALTPAISRGENETRGWEPESSGPELPLESKNVPPALPVAQRFTEILCGTLASLLSVETSEIDGDTDLRELGLDSIAISAFSAKMEEDWGVRIDTTLLYEYPTLREVAAAVAASQGNALATVLGVQEDTPSQPLVPVETPAPRPQADKRPSPSDYGRDVHAPRYAVMDIAIVGLTGRYPGHDDVEGYWQALMEGKDLIGEIPLERWDWRRYFGDPKEGEDSKTYSKWGGFLDDIRRFDAEFFRISPREAELMDPQQRLLLEEAWHLLEDAGYAPSALAGSETGVYIGISNDDYSNLLTRDHVKEQLYTATGSYLSIAANRISFFLGLKGPSLSIDTACASSLVAICQAVSALRAGECTQAIAGGVNLCITPRRFMAFSHAGMLSPDGRCKTFDSSANGYVRGEGVGLVLLKPAQQAISDGDYIYGIVKGSRVNHGGLNTTITAPSAQAQADLIVAAMVQADLDPAGISLMEAHGTGTPLGDPLEVRGLKKAFTELYQRRGKAEPATPHVAIGAVKTNIGHLEAASGIAGLTKVLMGMKYGYIPKNLHFQQQNPAIDLRDSPFYFPSETRPWTTPLDEAGRPHPRRAGVSSFGFGGANAHLIVEAYANERQACAANAEALVFPLSAASATALRRQAQRLADYLDAARAGTLGLPPNLHDIAYTLQTGREALEYRAALCARDIDALIAALRSLAHGDTDSRQIWTGQVPRRRGNALASLGPLPTAPEAVAAYWVQGGEVPWPVPTTGRRTPLPGYPFEGEAYWMPEPDPDRSHALRGNQPSTALRCESPQSTGHGNDTSFASWCEPTRDAERPGLRSHAERGNDVAGPIEFHISLNGQEFFLAEHRVENRPVLPGAAFVEMARDAGDRAGRKTFALEKIHWASPVIANPGADIVFRLTPENDRFHCEALAADGRLHAQCRLAGSSPKSAAWLDNDACRARCPTAIDVEDFYARLETLGLQIRGGAFQTIRELRAGSDEVWARLELDPAYVQDAMALHPALLDGAFQTCYALFFAAGDQRLQVPFAAERIDIAAPLPRRCLVQARRTRVSAQGISYFDIGLADEYGQVLATITDFVARPYAAKRPAPASLEHTVAVPADSLGFPVWQPATPPLREVDPSLPIVLFDSGEQHRQTLVQRYGRAVILVKPGAAFRLCEPGVYELASHQPEDYRRLLVELTGFTAALGGMVYLWGNAETAADPVAGVFQPLFLLTQALAASPLNAKLRIVLPYRNNADARSAAHDAVAGFARAYAKERPSPAFTLLATSTAPTPDLMLRALGWDVPSGERFRAEGEAIEHLEYSALEPTSTVAGAPLRQGGCYLITGGQGALGQALSGFLCERYGAKVMLAGRAAAGPETEVLLARLNSLGGAAHYQAADLGQASAVEFLIEACIEAFGTLHGVFHLAGRHHDRALPDKSLAEALAVLQPKIAGTLHLDRATAQLPLDFFCLYSSLAAPLGIAGQTDYAYANGFLDGFVEAREAQRAQGQRQGLTLAIHWPYWRDGGMKLEAQTEAWFREVHGLRPLETAEGLAILVQALERGWRRVAVSPKALPEAAAPVIAGDAPDREQLAGEIGEMVKQLLKIRSFDASKHLEDYGADSISLTELTNAINRRYGLKLTPVIFFEYPTVAGLLDHLEIQIDRSLDRSHALRGNAACTAPRCEPTRDDALGERDTLRSAAPYTAERYSARSHAERGSDTAGAIAIVGMAGIMPGSADLAQFWENLANGLDLVTEVPAERWDWRAYDGDPATDPNRTHCRWGGFMPGIDRFDHEFFGLTKREAMLMDPQQRLLLALTWHAIEDAGHKPSDLAGSDTGVYMGVSTFDYYDLIKNHQLDIEAHTATGVVHSILANRISWFYDLRGPSFPIDTACSSSLLAIHQALEAIAAGSCRAALVGGINLLASPTIHISFGKAGMLSPDGRCKTFDASADGYVRSEGAAVLYLKPLADALADSDPIYAVLRGSATNHGGRAKSLTAPNPNAQADLITLAQRRAGIDPATITYIEAHGTGTGLGDPIELQGLKKAFARRFEELGKQPASTGWCGIGSVKTNIGHLEAGAGLAGLCKILLAMQHGELPPTLHQQQENPYIDLADSPFYLVKQRTPWPRLRDSDGRAVPRRAGVSSFGFGGANAHVVLEEYLTPPPLPRTAPGPFLLVLSARNEERLREQARRLAEHLSRIQPNPEQLADIAYTLQVGREAMAVRLALLVSNYEEAAARLTAFADHGTIELADRSHALRGNAALDAPRPVFQTLALSTMDEVGSGAMRDAEHVGWVRRATTELADGYETSARRNPTQDADHPLGYDALSERIRDAERPELRSHAERGNDRTIWHGHAEENAPEPLTNDLAAIAAAFVRGASIDWQNLHDGSRRRVRLPGYSFAPTRCWLPLPADNPPEGGVPKPRTVPVQQDAVAEFQQGFERLEELATTGLIQELAGLGVLREEQARYHWPALRPAKLAQQMERLFDSLPYALVQRGLADYQQGILSLRQPGLITAALERDLDAESRALAENHPELAAHCRLLSHCLAYFAAVLLGEAPGTEALFPDADDSLVRDIYRNNPHADYLNRLAAQRLAEGYAGGAFHVLEVGAGTGGASAAALATLAGQSGAEYTYTDVSRHFLEAGRSQFDGKGLPLHFAVLDLEQDLLAQGFTPASFDAILAANVLHATRRVDETLRRLALLLKPGGRIVINELTRPPVFVTLTFGLLDGWWRYDAEETRCPGSPLLDLDRWRTVLENAGFEGVSIHGEEAAGALTQHVIEAQSVGWVRRATKEPADGDETSARRNPTQDTGHPLGYDAHEARLQSAAMLQSASNPTYDITAILEEELQTALRETGPIPLDRAFVDLGIDSIFGVGLIGRLNKKLGLAIKPNALFDHPTPRQLAAHLAEAVAAQDEERLIGHRQTQVTRDAERPEIRSHAERGSDTPPNGSHALRGNPPPTALRCEPAQDEKHLIGDRHTQATRDAERPGMHSHAERGNDEICLGIRVDAPTQPELLHPVPIPAPQPGPGALSIRVHAFSLNYGDLLCIKGVYPSMPPYPFTPGMEVAGEVAAVGAGVSGFAPGDRVVALTGAHFGGHASLALAEADAAVHLPPEIPYTEAVAFPVGYLVMSRALDLADVGPGDRVLIQSAASGVGVIGVQLARERGAEVFVTASADDKLDFLAKLGAQHGINYQREDFATRIRELTGGAGVDVVINNLGGDAMQKGLDLLAPGGRYVETAMMALRATETLDFSKLVDNQAYFSFDLRRFLASNPLKAQRAMMAMARTLAEGRIKPVVAKVFPFEQIGQAYAWVEARRNIGRVVVAVPQALNDPPAGRAGSQAPAWEPGLGSSSFQEPATARARDGKPELPLPRSQAPAWERGGKVRTAYPTQRAETGDIAVIGLAGRYPGAPDLDAFWRLLAEGRDGVSEVPVARWPIEAYYSPKLREPGRTYCRHGGFLADIDLFDAAFFNLSGAEAARTDPQQRLFLETAWEALEQAGYAQARKARCGVFVGVGAGDYQHRFLSKDLPPTAHVFSGNQASILAARIAYHLDLRGPALAVDTACSASLVAIHLACESLRSGESEMALAGGVFVAVTPQFHILCSQMGMLSPQGRCAAFDAAADGFVPGEGVGAVVLKPLERALADGDFIWGVIQGSGSNQDGATNGITAPSCNSQTELERQVYRRFGIDAHGIGYIETHGTGTPLGDPVEIEALRETFQGHIGNKIALGSVKSNIGHAATAAGIAGITKTLLALRHGQIPPSLHFQAANPLIDFAASPFHVNTRLQAWPAPADGPRMAAVSAFGFSGTNSHIVLAEAPPLPPQAEAAFFPTLVCCSGPRAEDARRVVARLAEFLADPPQGLRFVDLAYTLNVRRPHHAYRIVFPAADVAELRAGLARYLAGRPDAGVLEGQAGAASSQDAALAERTEALHEFLVPTRRVGMQSRRAAPRSLACAGRATHTGRSASPPHSHAARGNEANVEQRAEALRELGRLFVQGVAVPWEALFAGTAPRCIPMPTYPFERRRYWVDEAPVAAKPVGCGDGGTASVASDAVPDITASYNPFDAHPNRRVGTAHQNAPSPGTASPRWAMPTLQPDWLYIRDHVVEGRALLPGVAYLEFAAARYLEAHGVSPAGFRDIAFLRPLEVSRANTPFRVELDADGEFRCFAGAPETEHARGHILSTATPAPAKLPPMEQAISGLEYESADAFYARLERQGYRYGSSLRAVQALYCGADRAVARLRLPAAADPLNNFAFHPSLLDGALQAVAGSQNGERPLLPYLIGRLDLYAPLESEMAAHVQTLGPGRYRLTLTRLSGEVLLVMDEICARAMADPLEKLCYRPGFHALPPVDSVAVQPQGEVWIFHTPDSLPLHRHLAEHHAGQTVRLLGLATETRRLGPDEWEITPEALDQVMDEWPAPRLVYFLDLPQGEAELSSHERQGVFALLRLTQALQSRYPGAALAVKVVTGNAVDFPDSDVTPWSAGLHGFCRSAARELPEMRLSCIDVDLSDCSHAPAWEHRPGRSSGPTARRWSVAGCDPEALVIPLRGGFPTQERGNDLNGLAAAIVAEPGTESGGLVVLRSGQRFAPGLMPAKLPARPAGARNAYRPGGTYVILGGAGGIGLVLARHLILTVGARVALIGRRSPAAGPEAAVAELRALGGGDACYLQADATDPVAIKTAIAYIKDRFGPIHGAFHSAMVLADRSLDRMDQATFEAALHPKTQATVHFCQALADEDLDFLLLFSSLQSFVGGPGQTNYAAGCTFQDSYAAYWRSQVAYPVRLLHWGYWGSVGVVASESYRRRLAEMGLASIEPDIGMAALDRFLASDWPQMLVVRAEQRLLEELGVRFDGVWHELPCEAHEAPNVGLRRGRLTQPTQLQAADDDLAVALRAFADLESWCERWVPALLVRLGLEPVAADLPAVDVLAERWGVLPKFLPLLRALFRNLERSGYAVSTANGYRLIERPIPTWDALLAEGQALKTPAIAAFVELVLAAAENFAAVLQGRLPATEVLFPQGSDRRVRNIYRGHPIADYYNRLAGLWVRDLAENLAEPLRILEVGGGTGGTTSALLNALAGVATAYCFTDISPALVAQARQNFPGLEYRVFDLEQDPLEQGLLPGSFDLIVAGNAVHAGTDIGSALGRLKVLLRAGGWLLLNELTADYRFATLSFGLTDAWWGAQDGWRRLPDSPLLAPKQWLAVLWENGFRHAGHFGLAGHAGQRLIVAQSDGHVLLKSGQAPNLGSVPLSNIGCAEERSASVASDAVRTSPHPTMLADLCTAIAGIMAQILEIDAAELDWDTPHQRYGVDSILALAIVERIDSALNVRLRSTDFFNFATIRELALHIVELQPTLPLAPPKPEAAPASSEAALLDVFQRVAAGKLDVEAANRLILEQGFE